MKKLITFFLCLSIALCFGGPIQSRHAAVIAKKAAGGGGGHTYLFEEYFEGTGTPSGWYAGAGADFDNTSTPLAGAQHMRLDNGDFTLTPDPAWTAAAEVWFKFRFRMSALPSSSVDILTIRDGSGNTEFSLTAITDGTLFMGVASVPGQTVDALSAATSYDIEIHYTKGTGLNGVCTVGFVAAGGSIPTSGNKFASVNSGFGDANVASILLGDANCTSTDYDNIQVSVTQNP